MAMEQLVGVLERERRRGGSPWISNRIPTTLYTPIEVSVISDAANVAIETQRDPGSC